MNELIIRPLKPTDKTHWLPLFHAYGDFYQVPHPDSMVEQVWQWLMADTIAYHGLLAEWHGQAVGLAHYRPFLNSLTARTSCFFDDMYILPEARGQKIGAGFINELKKIAKANNWDNVTWMTADNNYRARTLYDQMAIRTHWVVYEMPIT